MTSFFRCRDCGRMIADSDDWFIDEVHSLIICRHCGATVCSEFEFKFYKRVIE